MDSPQPDEKTGIEYWASQPASYDGVLGKHCFSSAMTLRCDFHYRRLWLWGKEMPGLIAFISEIVIETVPPKG